MARQNFDFNSKYIASVEQCHQRTWIEIAFFHPDQWLSINTFSSTKAMNKNMKKKSRSKWHRERKVVGRKKKIFCRRTIEIAKTVFLFWFQRKLSCICSRKKALFSKIQFEWIDNLHAGSFKQVELISFVFISLLWNNFEVKTYCCKAPLMNHCIVQ